MEAMLRGNWDGAFRLYDREAKPSWDNFKHRFARYSPQVQPMDRTDLTPSRLVEGLRRMSTDASIGVDGWRVQELKQLPP